MHIDSYEFGRIVIDGRPYTADVVILPERILADWWRLEGHRLAAEDLKEVVKSGVERLVIGTGMYGRMQVPRETVGYLREQGIASLIRDTSKACDLFNEQQGDGGVAGAFHLTC